MAYEFRLPEYEIPQRLYRVHYMDSQTRWDKKNGFRAVYQELTPAPDRREMYYLIERHLDWESKFQSRYISTFSDKEHAINWAGTLQMERPFHLMTIEPTGSEWVAHMAEILESRGYRYRKTAYRCRNEYLFHRNIPANLIVEVEEI